MADTLAERGAEFLKKNAPAETSTVDASEYDGDENNIGGGDAEDDVQDPDEGAEEGVDTGDDEDAEGVDENAGEEEEGDEDAEDAEIIEDVDDDDDLNITSDDDLEFKDHPRFKELQEAEEQNLLLLSAIEDVQYPFADKEKPEAVAQELGLRLKDADVLYAILDGKPLLESLLITAGKNQGIERLKQIITQFDEFKQKYADDLGIELADEGADDLDEADPASREIKKLRGVVATLQRQIAGGSRTVADTTQEETKMKVFSNFSGRIEALGKKYGYDKSEIADFVNELGTAIGKSPKGAAIRARLLQGKFVDVDKLFIERHNRIETRVVKRSKAKLASAADKSKKFGSRPAGGREPGVVRTTTKPKTAEDRVAAGAAFLRNNK